MPLDIKRQARIGAARKLASEMAQDAATEHLPEEPAAVEVEVAPAETAEPGAMELSPEDAEKLSRLADMLK